MANIAHTGVHNGVTIEYTNNAQFYAGEQAECIRLVQNGIDGGFFTAYNRIRIIAGVHPFTVFSATGQQQTQQAHLTLQCWTGGAGVYRAHLWVVPADAGFATAATMVDPANPPTFVKK